MLIVTGMHRSGTTFLGKLIHSSGKFHVLHELTNPVYGVEGISCWYPYFSDESEDPKLSSVLDSLYRLKVRFKMPQISESSFKRAFRKFVKSRTHLSYLKWKLSFTKKDILLKEPTMALAVDHFLNRFNDGKVVYVVRHPIPIYRSIQNMSWSCDYRRMLEQPGVISLLESVGMQIDFETRNSDMLNMGLLWSAIYLYAARQVQKNSDRVLCLKHEDLCLNPESTIQNLLNFLGLPWEPRMDQFIEKHMNFANHQKKKGKLHDFNRDSRELATSWKKFPKLEDESVLDACSAKVLDYWYGDGHALPGKWLSEDDENEKG